MTDTKQINWLEETANLMRNRASHIKLKTIALDCAVSIAWLSKLQTGNLEDAKISKVQTVNEWLKKNV